LSVVGDRGPCSSRGATSTSVYCQNAEISQGCVGEDVTVGELAGQMLRLQRVGCHNINLVTPTHQAHHILAAVAVAREEGLALPLVWNCGGYESSEALRWLSGVVDIYMPDLKYGEDDAARRFSDAPGYVEASHAAVAEMHRQVGDLAVVNGLATRGVLIRHLVLPGDLAGTSRVLRSVAALSLTCVVHLMDQYRPAVPRAGDPAARPTDHAAGAGAPVKRAWRWDWHRFGGSARSARGGVVHFARDIERSAGGGAPRVISGKEGAMELLHGKRGLVFGVANERSIAWHIARNAIEHGATCGFAHFPGEKMAQRVRRTLSRAGVSDPWLCPCDASCDEDLDRLFSEAASVFEPLDFVVHSMAYADRDYLAPGKFLETPREVFSQALDVSAYTLVAIARRAAPLMTRGGSILSLSYYGAEKAVPGYNVMGVAKAALEAVTRYLAAELGQRGVRVNALSAGPCRTVSAMAIGEVDEMFARMETRAPLRRNITTDEVGKAALYLLSDLSSGVTGETHHVDAGFHTVAG